MFSIMLLLPSKQHQVLSAAQVKAFVELVASLLSASISNPNSQDGPTPPGLAGEMLRVMKEAGVLKGLTNALKLVDPNHPQVP